MKLNYEKAELEIIEIGDDDIITNSENVTPPVTFESAGKLDIYLSNDKADM